MPPSMLLQRHLLHLHPLSSNCLPLNLEHWPLRRPVLLLGSSSLSCTLLSVQACADVGVLELEAAPCFVRAGCADVGVLKLKLLPNFSVQACAIADAA